MDFVGSLVSVVEKLGGPIIQEASSLSGVSNQIEEIKEELSWMQSFLKDADAKQEGDEGVKNWVRTVRVLTYDVEDIIDTFVLKIAPLRQQGFTGKIKRYAFFLNELKARHMLASEMERIKSKIRSISERRLTYGIQNISLGEGTSSSSSQSLQEWRRTSPYIQEPDFIGFEEDLKTLVGRLIDMGEPRLCVVSVVGMGGLGKTTISRKVYNNDVVVGRHFELRAWISVSQEYVVKDLFQAILGCCVVLSAEELKKVEKMSVVELCNKISECLKEKRYLIVLDDVWQDRAWDDLKDAFPNMNNGSRVLLTTRNEKVALHADARSPPHKLRFLTEDESWDLFRKKSFLEQGSQEAQDLQKLGQEIVKRCQGLPLAIVVIGGLLSTITKVPRAWEKVLRSISWQFVEGEVQIFKILSLSYKDLPYHLKPCFLYLGIFPEDYNFSAKRLIELWLAEGFLKQRGNATLEEVGEDCLMELVQRSLVQVAERSSAGGIKSCRMHDLLRDLCISEAREDKFLEIHHGGNVNNLPASSARRLVVDGNALSNFTSLNCSTPHLRSLFSFQANRSLRKKQVKFLFQGFKLLRVLDLHGKGIRRIPTEIGELIHLRYLGLRDPSVGLKRLPSSIGNLGNLQSLNITCSYYMVDVQFYITKMRQLRHLRLKYYVTELMSSGRIRGRPGLDEMSNLQTLTQIVATKWIRSCLGKLTNLRKLGLQLNSIDACMEVYKSIVELHCLESLYLEGSDLYWGDTERMPTLVPLTNLHKLSKLHLHGRIEKLPESCEFPANLTKLTLSSSKLEQDPLQTPEKLENLRILRLWPYSYIGKEMACSSQGFPRLESLHFDYLINLEEWTIEEGALSSLLHLRIGDCGELKMLPEGLQRMTALKKLELWYMNREFENKLRKEDGEDWHKIQNIPSIDIRS